MVSGAINLAAQDLLFEEQFDDRPFLDLRHRGRAHHNGPDALHRGGQIIFVGDVTNDDFRVLEHFGGGSMVKRVVHTSSELAKAAASGAEGAAG